MDAVGRTDIQDSHGGLIGIQECSERLKKEIFYSVCADAGGIMRTCYSIVHLDGRSRKCIVAGCRRATRYRKIIADMAWKTS